MHLRLSGVSYGHADHTLFENVSLELFPGERVALLGHNGGGKTTLLRILAGLETPHSGALERLCSVTYLAQREYLPHQTLGEVLWPDTLERAKHTFERTTLALEDPTPQNLEQYAGAEEVWRIQGGYDFETCLNSVLEGLDLSPNPGGLPTVRRTDPAGAAGEIIARAGRLLSARRTHQPFRPRFQKVARGLDSREPRSVFDGVARLGLSGRGGHPNLRTRAGKTRALQRQLQRGDDGKSRVARVCQDCLSERDGQEKSARAMESHLERLDIPEKPFQRRELTRIPLAEGWRGASDVLKLEHLTLERSGKTILTDLNLWVKRGEKLALLGPNGTGKSTLLELLLGRLELKSGSICWGPDLQIYTVGQQGQELEHFATVQDALLEAGGHLKRQHIFERLAFLGLPKDPLHRVDALSGGERTRLSLARPSVTQAQVMVLDEPTNHLDVEAIEVLENLLLKYEGTVIFASHDASTALRG